jgi:isoleucyl-tRNA synthetase
MLARYGETAEKMLTAYENYDYGTIFQALNAFATVDLSALYVDVSKDRLYTFAPNAPERRSAQTVMYLIADGLTRLMAPILSFTADEIWRFLPAPPPFAGTPGRREESVHMALFPDKAQATTYADKAVLEPWTRLVDLRQRVLAEIEPLRTAKKIGSSLQAKVVLSATAADLAWLRPYAGDLPMLFIVSEVELRAEPPGADTQAGAPRISIERSSGVKCERCWRYVPGVSTDPEWAGLCDRCHGVLAGAR